MAQPIGPGMKNGDLAHILDGIAQTEKIKAGTHTIVALTARQLAAIDEASNRLAESLDQE